MNNQRKTVRDYINREKLIYKCFTCSKTGHLTKNCKSKAKLCPKCKAVNYPSNCPEANWKCTNCGGNLCAAYKGCPSNKSATSKSLDRHQNISYAHTVYRRTADEKIEAFKVNIIRNVPQLTKIITRVIWETDREDYNFVHQLANRVFDIVRQSVKNSTIYKYGFFQRFFFKICSCQHMQLQKQGDGNISFS